jgi:hypothetical protein
MVCLLAVSVQPESVTAELNADRHALTASHEAPPPGRPGMAARPELDAF